MATDDQLDVDTIMSEFTIEPEDSATDTVQVSTADHNSNNNSSSSNNNAAAVAEAAPEITEPAAADCIAEGAAAGSADTPPAEPQSPTVTVAAATPMGGNAAGEDQLFTLDPALTVPDGDPEGEGADTDLPPRPPANRRNDTPREGAPVTPAGSTTRARSASSAAALSAAKASGAQGVSLGDFEGLLVEKDAQISDLQESNRYFLRQAQAHDEALEHARLEAQATLAEKEAAWDKERQQLIQEKKELLAEVERLEADLEAATQDTHRFGVNASSPVVRRQGDPDDIDALMASSSNAPSRGRGASSSADSVARSHQAAPVSDCMSFTLTRASIYDSFGVEFLELGKELDDPHLVVRATHGSATKTGIRRLDRLLSINGEQVTTFSALSDAVANNLKIVARIRRPPVQLNPQTLNDKNGKGFKVGDIVRISGLQKAVAFNSKIARVIQEMSVGGTYTIELLDNTQQLLVFPGNIELVRDDGPRNLSGFDRSNPSALDALVADLSAMSIVQLRKQLREKGLPIDLEKEDAVRLLTKHAQAHDPALHAASPAKNGSVAGASSKVGASVPSASLLKPEPTELVKGTTRAFVENASIFLSPHYNRLLIAFERRLQKPYDWVNVDCSAFPAPLCRVSSPVIKQLISSWSLDPDHMKQFQQWLTDVVRGQISDPSFRWQCELSRLHIDTLRGFLTVLVPLLTTQAPVPVLVYVRRTRLLPGEEEALYSAQDAAKFIDMRIALNGWQQLDCFDTPVPNFGLSSPVVQDILDCWTDDRERIRRLNEWMAGLMTGSSQPRSRGVELVDVPLDVARGLVTLLVPILIHTAPVGINIYTRRARRSLSTIKSDGSERFEWDFRSLSTVDLLNLAGPDDAAAKSVTSASEGTPEDGALALASKVENAGIALDIRMELRHDY
eukprot:INCI5953.1.p1 GENE.INCI5953.1~~INCI5953.1.p1  ORF type:complete len:906 (-),score=183.68 INCI5953.1:195-2912(-)